MSGMQIESLPDDQVDAELDAALRKLLFASFAHEPVLQTRRYVKEPPQQRFFVRNEDGSIRAHAAVHRKTIRAGERQVPIGAIAEVAVDSAHRGQGYVRALMQAVDDWLRRQGVSFAMLIGVPAIYRSSGYRELGTPIRYWEAGAWKEEINACAMVRELGPEPWPAGLTDLCGPLF